MACAGPVKSKVLATQSKTDRGVYDSLHAACIKRDVETVITIVNCAPTRVDTALAILKVFSWYQLSGSELTSVMKAAKFSDYESLEKEVFKAGTIEQVCTLLSLQQCQDNERYLNQLLMDDTTLLMWACSHNTVDVVDYLVSQGAALCGVDSFGRNVLHLACWGNRRDVAHYLLKKKPSLLMKNDSDGCAPIHTAAIQGNTSIVDLLLQYGASVGAKTQTGSTPLMLAGIQGHLETFYLLLSKTTCDCVDDRDNSGMTALSCVCKSNQCDVAEALLEKGASVNATDGNKSTPLHHASLHGNQDIVALLLSHGADLEATTSFKATPLMVAASGGNLQIVQYLLDFSTHNKINAWDENGMTALHRIIDENCSVSLDIVELLLRHGANANVTQIGGESPLLVAVRRKNKAITKLLLRHGAHVKCVDEVTIIEIAKFVYGDAQKYIADIAEVLLLVADVSSRSNIATACLAIAIDRGHTNIAEILIELGADVNHKAWGLAEYPLIIAVENGDQEMTRFLLLHGANIDVESNHGLSALSVACGKADTTIIEILLQHGARVMTSLSFAVQRGHSNIAEMLLKHAGADANCTENESSENLLMIAVKKGDQEMVKLLLRHGADVNVESSPGFSALSVACSKEDTAIMEILLQNEAYVNWIGYASFESHLFTAVTRGDQAGTEVLLRHGADVDLKSSCGITALSVAAGNGDTNIMEMLLQHGASVDAKNNDGMTALFYTTDRVNAELLLKNGADVNIQSQKGATALIYAVNEGHLDIAKLLLEHGADPDTRRFYSGTTALFDASYGGNAKMVELLLAHKADANVQNSNGMTSLLIAVQEGHSNIAEMLLEHGADVNHTANGSCESPLVIAIEKGDQLSTKLLLRYGANCDVETSSGDTVLCIAAGIGDKDIVRMLLQHGARVYQTGSRLLENPLIVSKGREYHATMEFSSTCGAVGKTNPALGKTALYIAALKGHNPIVQMLLQNGGDANLENNGGNIILFDAVDGGHTDVVQTLLEHGLSANAQNECGTTALCRAAEKRYMDIVRTLLKYGAEVNCSSDGSADTLLITSVKKEDHEMTEFLLNYGADANMCGTAGTADSQAHLQNVSEGNDMTPLLLAVQSGSALITELLISRGADINFAGKHGTALTLALDLLGRQTSFNTGTYKDISRVLIEHGADVNATSDESGQSSLISLINSSLEEEKEMVELLLNKGAQVNARDIHNRTPLYYAILRKWRGTVEALLRHEADVNAVFTDSITPLMCAVLSNDSQDMVELLIAHGADLGMLDAQGESALFKAVSKGCTTSVQTLLLHGADVNSFSVDGVTPLICSVLLGNGTMVSILLEGGADVNAVDESEMTALHHAAMSCADEAIVETLVRARASVNARDAKGRRASQLSPLPQVEDYLRRCESRRTRSLKNMIRW